jgi:hypothetical protein
MSGSKKPNKGSKKGSKKGQKKGHIKGQNKGQNKDQKKGQEKGPVDPKHPKKDERRKGPSLRQILARKERGVQNSELANKIREEKEQKTRWETREQENRAPESEPVVEPGNQLQNEVLETVPGGENRAGSPVVQLRKEAATDKMSVCLPRLNEVPAQIIEMMRYYLPCSKPRPLSSKPSASKSFVEPSTSKTMVEPSTSNVVKKPRLEVHDENILGDSSPPKRKRMTKVRLEKEAQERAQEKARQKAEVARTHEMQLLEQNELRTGIRKTQIFPLRK